MEETFVERKFRVNNLSRMRNFRGLRQFLYIFFRAVFLNSWKIMHFARINFIIKNKVVFLSHY